MSSETLRTDRSSPGPLSDADREARIEQLLLSGLDQYFSGHYEQAINIWTRVAFLERGHGRARAYIERARGALAERQRESDELMHGGVNAYNAGDMAVARDLLTRAVEHGGPTDTALLFLQRLSRVESPSRSVHVEARAIPAAASPAEGSAPARSSWALTVLVSAGVAAAIMLPVLPIASWLAELPIDAPPITSTAVEPIPIVRPSDLAVARAQALVASGQPHEALRVLEAIGIADPQRAEADRVRADAQRALLGMPSVPRDPGVTP